MDVYLSFIPVLVFFLQGCDDKVLVHLTYVSGKDSNNESNPEFVSNSLIRLFGRPFYSTNENSLLASGKIYIDRQGVLVVDDKRDYQSISIEKSVPESVGDSLVEAISSELS